MSEQDKQKVIERLESVGLRRVTDADKPLPHLFRRTYQGDVLYGFGARVGTHATTLDGTIPHKELVALLNPITKDQAQTAFWGAVMAAVRRQHPIGSLTHNELDAVANDFLERLFPEEAPTDANPAGGKA